MQKPASFTSAGATAVRRTQSGSEEDDDDYDHDSFAQERTSGLALPQPNPLRARIDRGAL
jgi:hypothetical protein